MLIACLKSAASSTDLSTKLAGPVLAVEVVPFG